jgi:hypothetical protein
MAQSKSGRVIMRIEIPQKAVDSFTTSAEKRGMTHIATTSRIVEWFINQDEEVIAAVLGTHPTPPSPDELARMIIEKIKRG